MTSPLITRRRLIVGGAAAVGMAAAGAGAWSLRPYDGVRLLFTNDMHSHLRPVYHREAHDGAFLRANGIAAGSEDAYLTTSVEYLDQAKRHGRVGGWAHIKTVIDRERDAAPGRTLVLDAADTWYGSGIALLTEGRAAVQVMNEMGYDAMTLHWEFNFGKKILLERIKEAKFPVICQNLRDEFGDRILEPSIVRQLGTVRVGVIGQGYSFSLLTTEFTSQEQYPGWRMGYDEDGLREEIARLRTKEQADVIVVLSHMGYEAERAIAQRVPGIDVIVGGHTHDIIWRPERVGSTLIVQAGSHGKFLGELDLEVRGGKVDGFRHRLVPIVSERIEPHPGVKALIDRIYAPHEARLGERIGETSSVLYRRSLYGGTTDAMMAAAYKELSGSDIGCCPGWRFGTSILPGPITIGDVYDAMKPTPTPLYVAQLNGRQLREVMEDILDNVFATDPMFRLGGELSRCLGVKAKFKRDAPRGRRVLSALVNGEALGDRKYSVGTSGGRTQLRDPEFQSRTKPAFEELIGYISARSPITAQPISAFEEA